GDPDSWFFYPPRSHRDADQLVDNGGGSYTFTFDNTVVLAPAEAGYTHRVGIEIYNLPSGLLSVNPTSDWVPDNSALTSREIVITANCNECHNTLGYTPSFHGSRRVEIKHCQLCHNPNNDLAPQSADPGAPSVPVPFVKLVHGIHTGQDLLIFEDGENHGDFTEIHIPQDIRNCTKCHKGGADSDNWKTQPTIEACGSCHEVEGVVENPVNFATGEGHLGGPQANNSGCVGCHPPASIEAAMATENVTPNNQDLPVGLSRFGYFIDNVAVDNTGVATVGFRITQDGAPFDLDSLQDNTAFSDRRLSFLLAWALPQDGIDAPAEYNNRNSPAPPSSSTGNGGGDAASVSLGDLITDNLVTGTAAGYTTVLSARPFPAGATMRAVALQSYFEQIVGGEEIGRHTPSVMAPVPGDAVRRQVVKSGYTNNNDPLTGQPEGCLECHETLELHGGSRVNNVQVCVFCHNPNKSSSGRTADPMGILRPDTVAAVGSDPLLWPEATNNFKNMIHGLHAATDRPYEFVRNRTNGRYYSPAGLGGEWPEKFLFPGDLRYCEKCHLEDTYRPENLPAGTLWEVERTTTGNPAETRADIIAARSSVPNLTDLVDSPIAGACYYCHDGGVEKSHIMLQGGQLSITREDALGLP
ncbi:MAG: OmcA/MtrC family decaheme c-type cytochrome, partial [Candidatus Deferrimicrobiaceae bacterium]